MGTATAWQCARETVARLAVRAAKLGDALAAARINLQVISGTQGEIL